jgi:hypothetical protein
VPPDYAVNTAPMSTNSASARKAIRRTRQGTTFREQLRKLYYDTCLSTGDSIDLLISDIKWLTEPTVQGIISARSTLSLKQVHHH